MGNGRALPRRGPSPDRPCPGPRAPARHTRSATLRTAPRKSRRPWVPSSSLAPRFVEVCPDTIEQLGQPTPDSRWRAAQVSRQLGGVQTGHVTQREERAVIGPKVAEHALQVEKVDSACRITLAPCVRDVDGGQVDDRMEPSLPDDLA